METGEAEIQTYDDLVHYMIARRTALGLTQLALDDLCGFFDGYVSHLENHQAKHGRVAGSATMRRWFLALGVRLKPIAEAPAAVQQERLPDELAHRRRERA